VKKPSLLWCTLSLNEAENKCPQLFLITTFLPSEQLNYFLEKTRKWNVCVDLETTWNRFMMFLKKNISSYFRLDYCHLAVIVVALICIFLTRFVVWFSWFYSKNLLSSWRLVNLLVVIVVTFWTICKIIHTSNITEKIWSNNSICLKTKHKINKRCGGEKQ
jgi:hypothetical protein